MNQVRINFSKDSWVATETGTRSKTAVRNGRKLRLVEFTSEFVELDWCAKNHVGYVLAGELEIIFPDRTEKFKTGDGIMITGGEFERHKAKITGAGARLVLVEDADEQT